MDCILCGKCKKSCPAYKVYREEIYSPRGKMALHYSDVDNREVDFKCFFCGNCVGSCPFDIDVPIEFLFEKKIIAKAPNSEKILVDNIGLSEEKRARILELSSVVFDKVITISDGVHQLNSTKSRVEIEAFYEFLKENAASELYFVEKSSFLLAKRVGHDYSKRLIETMNIDYIELPNNFTSYYSILSDEQLSLLDFSLLDNLSGVTDVNFNFGNQNLTFYTEEIDGV